MTLTERLAAATEGSRELDALIWIAAGSRDGFNPLAAGYRWEFEAEEDGAINCYAAMVGEKDRPSYSRKKKFRPEPFSTSLDAALTLVPEGWFLESLEELVTRYQYSGIWGQKTGQWQAEVQEVKEQGSLKMARAPTAPLALCIAALKARGIE